MWRHHSPTAQKPEMHYNFSHESFSPPRSEHRFLEVAKCFEYLQILFIDINGVARGKVVPADRAYQLLLEGCKVSVNILAFAYTGHPTMTITEFRNHNFGNVILRPIVSTLRQLPRTDHTSSPRIGQVFSDAIWLDRLPIKADSRAIAIRQLQRLDERNLHLYNAMESEFWMFEPNNGSQEEPCPAHNTSNPYMPRHYDQYEQFYVQLDRSMRAQGFSFLTFHTETDKGELEIAFAPEWGIIGADNVVRFKLLAHKIARDTGYRCSFMSQPIPHVLPTFFNFNHSVWRGAPLCHPNENVMLDFQDPEKVSSFCRHWLAGLLHHAPALTAIFAPTVNSYRILNRPGKLTPSCNDWDFNNRSTSINVKNEGSNDGTYVEERIPSSASNPYLVMAGVIAAGLDGIDSKLQLPPKKSEELGALPKTLSEALEALTKDTVLCDALGSQLIEWFVAIKEKEIEELKDVDITVDNEEDFKKERDMYFDTA